MLRNYFKYAWRNIWKNKFFSLINILGLGLAIPFALLSIIQMQSTYESDNFHPYPGRTYRINTNVKDNGGNITKYALSPEYLAEDLRTNYPAIQLATFTVREYGWELSDRLKTLPVNTLFVEPEFFDMFGFHFISGSRPVEPNSIAITKEKAEAFFGKDDVTGMVLSHPEYGDFVISGVLVPFKQNTVFRTDVMVSMATWKKHHPNSLPSALNGYTFTLMRPNTTAKQLETALKSEEVKINEALASNAKKETLSFHKQGIEDIAPAVEKLEGNSYVDSVSDLAVNFAFALGVLILAAFNYINLTLARSINRAKEVGLRKTVGALRYQLISQFIYEAVLMTLLSLAAGYIILQLLKRFSYVNWFAWEVDNQAILWIAFILFTILIGILAGFIPAKVLSAFRPVNVLKGNIAPSAIGKTGLRNALVVIQFVASACFIFALMTVFNQFNYMATDNTNFNRNNIYNIAASDKLPLLKHDILENKNVKQVGFVSIPFGGNSAKANIKKDNLSTDISANYYAADAAFVSNMHLPIVAGRNLFPSSGDSVSAFVLVNEQLLSSIGITQPHDGIGKTFILNNQQTVSIIGVLPNFCYDNYQFAASPLIIQYNPSQFHVMSIQAKNDVDQAVFKSEMLGVWKRFFPHNEMSFSNYKKDLHDRYSIGGMDFMGMFCAAVLIIALMGLLGIITYHTESRIKEVGIRKVLGASIFQIIRELSAGFVKLTILSALIALPLGYSISYFFVKLFAYSDGVNVVSLALLFTGIFSIALLIIVYKSISAAIANPVKSLRTE